MGGGEEGGHVCGCDGVRGDKVMSDIRMQRPHDMNTCVNRVEPSMDLKKSDFMAYREMRSRR